VKNKMAKFVRQPQERVTMNLSQGFTEIPEKAFCGKNNRYPLPKMLTQSLLQSKDLITSNTKQSTESLDSADSCVCGSEKKKQRIGVRLSFSERQALEIEAKQIGLNLSTYIRRALISKNIAA
jgi:predicted DNA binding CopG/RHH family protein